MCWWLMVALVLVDGGVSFGGGDGGGVSGDDDGGGVSGDGGGGSINRIEYYYSGTSL